MGRPTVIRARLDLGPVAASPVRRHRGPARLALGLAALLTASLAVGPGLVAASVSRPPSASVLDGPAGTTFTTTPLAVIDPSTPLPTTALNQALLSLRAKYGIPGMQATMIYPDGRTWTATTGFSNYSARIRMTKATAFGIASVTKTFTAALILRLAEQGKLSVDDTLGKWLPDLVSLYPTLPPTVTILQMMNHTSGLADFFANPSIDGVLQRSPRWTWNTARSLSYVQAPYFAPGTSWAYSNTNYLLLGLIAERAGGATFAAQVNAQFSGPLGLTSTFVQRVDPWRAPTSHGYKFASSLAGATPIDLSDGSPTTPFTSVVTAAAAAGDIASSSWDLAHWAFALYGGHVLQPASLALMLDTSASVSVGASVPYGGGVQRLTVNGYTTYGHGGSFLGSRDVIWYQPDSGVAIAVTTNQSRMDPGIIAKALLAIAVPPPA